MNNTPQTFWRIVSFVGVMIVIFLVVLSIKELKSIAYVGKSEQIINTISVSGKGEFISKPDIATFSFSVTETAKNVLEAQNAASTKMNNALKLVRDGGVAETDIQTTSYTINPHYEYQSSYCPVNSGTSMPCKPGRNIMTGYDVSQTVVVKIRNLDKAGDLFSAIGGAGVDNVNGLSFGIDKPEAVKEKARSLAISNAKMKAEALANQLGVRLVRITGFYESNDAPMPIYGMGGAMTKDAYNAASVAPEIPAGEQKVTNYVTVTYEIE